MLERHDLIPKTVLDIGCGTGDVIVNLSRIYPSTKFLGYEPSQEAYRRSQGKQAGDHIRFVTGKFIPAHLPVDLLISNDVLEHVSDYLGFLGELRHLGEYKIFHIPLEMNVLSILRNSPTRSRKEVGHLHYFSLETALETLQDCGYQVEDWFFTPFFIDLRHQNARRWPLHFFARWLLYRLSPRHCARLLGGCSLLVLAK